MTEPTREQLDNLLDHAHKRRLGPDEVGRIREGIAALRQQVALSQAGASQREALLTEARDALQDAELRGHGDCWPDITAPILALIAERDRWRRGYDFHYQRAENAEEGDQRVRDYATGLKGGTVSHGLTAAGCADRIVAALDGKPVPAADGSAEPDPPKMPVGEFMRRLAEAFERGRTVSDDAERAALMRAILTRESEAISVSVYVEPEPADWRGARPHGAYVDEAVPAADSEPAAPLTDHQPKEQA